ncbi:MAG: efflux RND transporter periplasmic adaptor subunit, partial [Gammaproteobacteria bacterium]
DGVAVSVHANAGEKVARGDLLAVISSQSLAEMRHAVTRADAKVALARETFQREASLWREGISPEQDYRRAEHALKTAEIDVASAQAQLRALGATPIHGQSGQFSLRASIAGTVIDKHLAVGESVSPETRVYTIAALSSVWAEAKVGARELANLRTGQQARVSAAAPDLATDGEVSYLSALLGEQDRAVTARVVLDNAGEGWRPGLPVTIRIVTGAKEVPTAISIAALQLLRDWQVVFVRYGEYFEARPLDLGARDDHRVEVIAGLRAGEQYAATNSYAIKADIGKAGASHEH